jgi:hypothetical protein
MCSSHHCSVNPLLTFGCIKAMFWLKSHRPTRLRLATLPNRFFAVVPAEQAEELAEQGERCCEGRNGSGWQKSFGRRICQRVSEFAKGEVHLGRGSWRSFPKFTGRFTSGMRRHKRLPNSFGN